MCASVEFTLRYTRFNIRGIFNGFRAYQHLSRFRSCRPELIISNGPQPHASLLPPFPSPSDATNKTQPLIILLSLHGVCVATSCNVQSSRAICRIQRIQRASLSRVRFKHLKLLFAKTFAWISVGPATDRMCARRMWLCRIYARTIRGKGHCAMRRGCILFCPTTIKRILK